MCGGNKKSRLGHQARCCTCGAQLMANSCIYYPYHCPVCGTTDEYACNEDYEKPDPIEVTYG